MPHKVNPIDFENSEGNLGIANALLGKPQTPRPFLYREFSGYGGQQAVWMGRFKGIRQRLSRPNNPNRLKIELYDLKADVAESTDVAARHPDVVARIRDLMKREHNPSKLFPIKALDGTDLR